MSSRKGPRTSGRKKRPLSASRAPSVEGQEMSVELSDIPPHKHCLNCGVSIPPDRDTCSDKCKTEWDRMLSRKKFWNYLPLIGAAFLALLWLILMMSG